MAIITNVWPRAQSNKKPASRGTLIYLGKLVERVPAIPATTHANAFKRATRDFSFLSALHANWHDSPASYAKTT